VNAPGATHSAIPSADRAVEGVKVDRQIRYLVAVRVLYADLRFATRGEDAAVWWNHQHALPILDRI
jgi:hypothetical protein